MLIKLAVGKDGNERVPAWHAELGIHLPLLTRVTNAMVNSKTSVKKNAPGRAE